MHTSTFTLSKPYPQIPVYVPSVDSDHSSTLTSQELLSSPAFKTWLSTLTQSLQQQHETSSHPFHPSPYGLRSITVNSLTRFGGRRIGFLNLTATISNEEGEKLPGSALLRGGSVGMLILLQPDDVAEGSQEEKHVVLTVQPRIPAGSLTVTELPAGMLDDSGSFAGAAAKEIEEECGLSFGEDDMIDVTALALDQDESGEVLQKGVFPSPGGCDEFIPIFLCERRVRRDELHKLAGRLTGLREHGGKITMKLCKFNELWKVGARDGKALSALALYDGLRAEGRLAGR